MSADFLSESEALRYARHLSLPGFGMDAQLRLKQASVLVIGSGGLGSPVCLYLASAGIGHLGIVDFDEVDVSNLQRQVLFATPDVGRRKALAAAEKVEALNPEVRVTVFDEPLSSSNAMKIMDGFDLVIDGSDNFPTRYLVNDASVLLGIPNVYGSIFRFEGQLSVFGMPNGPCYRCLFPQPPKPGSVPSCSEAGVLGVLPGLLGVMQATEAIKVLTGIGDAMSGRVLMVDALGMQFRELSLEPDPECPVCGGAPTVTSLIDYEQFCGVRIDGIPEVSPADFEEMRTADSFLLLDVREPDEFQAENLNGYHIPLGDLPSRMEELEGHREGTILVHCQSGGRSARGAKLLKDSGFADVRNLSGGLRALKQHNSNSST